MVLIFMALASGAYLLLPNKAATPKPVSPAPVAQSLPWSDVATNTTLTVPEQKKETRQPEQKNSNVATDTPSEATPTTTPIPEKNTLSVTIIINGQNYSLLMAEKSTAYDAMAQLVDEKKITAIFKPFSSLGYFVDEIDGVKTDKNAGKYWIYYLNSKPAQTGISNYILKNNDSLTWKYEVPQF